MCDWLLVAAAGFSDSAARSDGDGGSLFQLFALLGLAIAISLLGGLLLQRVLELIIGRWRTTTREVLLYTFLVATLCTMVRLIQEVARN